MHFTPGLVGEGGGVLWSEQACSNTLEDLCPGPAGGTRTWSQLCWLLPSGLGLMEVRSVEGFTQRQNPTWPPSLHPSIPPVPGHSSVRENRRRAQPARGGGGSDFHSTLDHWSGVLNHKVCWHWTKRLDSINMWTKLCYSGHAVLDSLFRSFRLGKIDTVCSSNL